MWHQLWKCLFWVARNVQTACKSIGCVTENLRRAVTPSLVLLYSLCVVQWLEESNTKRYQVLFKKQIDITLSLDQFSESWNGDTKIPVCFFPFCVFFNPRDQHFHVVVLALQSLLAFPCSAAPQLVTTGRYRIRPNPVSPRDLMGFSKHCWSRGTGFAVQASFSCRDCWWGQHMAWHMASRFPVRCAGTQLSISTDLDCGIVVSYMNSSLGEYP